MRIAVTIMAAALWAGIAAAAPPGTMSPQAGALAAKIPVGQIDPNTLKSLPQVDLNVIVMGKGTVSRGGETCVDTDGGQKTCVWKAIQGAHATFTATPAAGMIFGGWGGDCQQTAPTCTVPTDKPVSIIFAKFKPKPQFVTISIDLPNRGGIVKSSSGPSSVVCYNYAVSGKAGFPPICSEQVPYGTPVSFSAQADAFSQFVNWSSEQPGCTGSQCAFTATADAKLQARFSFVTPYTYVTVVSPAGVTYGWYVAPNAQVPSSALEWTCADSGPSSPRTCKTQVPDGLKLQLQASAAGKTPTWVSGCDKVSGTPPNSVCELTAGLNTKITINP